MWPFSYFSVLYYTIWKWLKKTKRGNCVLLSYVGLWLAGHEAHDMSFNRTREAHRKKTRGYYSHVRYLMHQKIIYASLAKLLHARWASVAMLFMQRIASIVFIFSKKIYAFLGFRMWHVKVESISNLMPRDVKMYLISVHDLLMYAFDIWQICTILLDFRVFQYIEFFF